MSSSKKLLLGIDVGSTTVKCVVTDSNFNTLHSQYERHNARQPEAILELLDTVVTKFDTAEFNTFITGSGGRVIAPLINARYIQEVNAVTYAVEQQYPDTGAVIELGGQDAKVIIWKGDEEDKTTLTFMNDKCAGGTGATIDKILAKIGMKPEDAANVDPTGKSVHHIAAKCGVFAETDVVGLIKAGIDREEILISLCNAVVKQNLEVLVKGNILRDKVLLLGGPHTFIKAFTKIWRDEIPKTWKMHDWIPADLPIEELVRVPENAQYFAALGALLYGVKSDELYSDTDNTSKKSAEHIFLGTKKLSEYIKEGRLVQLEASGAVRDGLVKNEDELEEFRKQYTIPKFIQPEFDLGSKLDCYIGIDGGSTSTKMVLLNREKEILYKDYILSRGNPIDDLKDMFSELLSFVNEKKLKLNILGTAVTGYASAILIEAFSLDASVVETVAHMKSSIAQYGDIDVICDVGGQDIKVLFMKHGRVVDFKLNTQCSAGNGYFLQGMAEQFGIPIEEYAEHSFKARKTPAFNYGCAVFMEQDKVNFQQLGWRKEEIMAGLAQVLPLNIWNYVVQETNIGKYGNRIVLQGGTQKNLAAVKAQVDYLKEKVPDAQVFVHKYSDVAGAIGAAIEIIDRKLDTKSSFIGIVSASKISYRSKNDLTTKCDFCTNKCRRTFIDTYFDGKEGIRFISGYGCEKGEYESRERMLENQQKQKDLKKDYPNLVADAAKDAFSEFDFATLPEKNSKIAKIGYYPANELNKKKMKKISEFKRSEGSKRSDMVIGIPKLLNMFMYTPFFSTYFRVLGVKKVVYSDYTTQKLWNAGNKWGAIDPCFPAKVAPAHIYDMIDKGEATHICFPMITHLQSNVNNTLGNNACVIQMGTPEVVEAVFTRDVDYFAKHNIEYFKPLVAMDQPLEACGLMFEYFENRLGITEDENAWAVNEGLFAMKKYIDNLQAKASTIINNSIVNNKLAILMIGHPYHNDPGLNHGILDSFQALGYPILSIESLPVDDDFLVPIFGKDEAVNVKDVWERNFNRNTNLKIWAAKVAARHPNIAVIDLSSFKCGHDAPTYSYIDNILDASETPHFLFHDVDQSKPGASIKIRIQTINYFLNLEERRMADKKGK